MVLVTSHLLCIKMNSFISSVAALWIMAAKWEMETRLSSESARHLFLRALRFHPECPKLYQEVSLWFSWEVIWLFEANQSSKFLISDWWKLFPPVGGMLSKRFKNRWKTLCIGNMHHFFLVLFQQILYLCLQIEDFVFSGLDLASLVFGREHAFLWGQVKV